MKSKKAFRDIGEKVENKATAKQLLALMKINNNDNTEELYLYLDDFIAEKGYENLTKFQADSLIKEGYAKNSQQYRQYITQKSHDENFYYYENGEVLTKSDRRRRR